jgi:hypothetical protein
MDLPQHAAWVRLVLLGFLAALSELLEQKKPDGSVWMVMHLAGNQQRRTRGLGPAIRWETATSA